MQKILENFLEISKIRRCSYQTQEMEEFLIDFAKKFDYTIKVDKAKNILIYKNNPKIALQAHYDMVCVGEAPNIQLEIKDNIIRAKNSSLGADNGIAIAMMMELIKERVDAEFLFTNDEEVGLIGAKNLELSLKSRYLLNLDSEDEATIYIGCAGGADIVGEYEDTLIESNLTFYEVAARNLPGGHSGVDINKNIPSAIKEVASYLKENNITTLATFNGGERRNSIPSNAVAIVGSKEVLESKGLIEVKRLNKSYKVLKNGSKLIDLINNFPHGVIEVNKELEIPNISINLAKVTTKDNKIEFIATTRAMDEDGLKSINKRAINLLKQNNFKVKIEDKYPAWKPTINSLTKITKEAILKEYNRCDIKAIHAGLECGVLSKKLPLVEFCSIGPNIRFPHSTREYCELDSVAKTYKVIKEIINSI